MATIEYDLDLTGGLMDVSIMDAHECSRGWQLWFFFAVKFSFRLSEQYHLR